MNQTNDSRKTVKDDTVVTLDYTLQVDGGVVDTSEENEPIQFIQGHNQIIPGLERELYGMTVGESKKVVVPPKEGYGEADDAAYTDIPRGDFPREIPLETGVVVQVRDQRGDVIDAYIAGVTEESVRLNFNHPLAGKELHFSVTVVDLRDATDDEISHGHIHGEDGEEIEEWIDDDDEDEDDEEWEYDEEDDDLDEDDLD